MRKTHVVAGLSLCALLLAGCTAAAPDGSGEGTPVDTPTLDAPESLGEDWLTLGTWADGAEDADREYAEAAREDADVDQMRLSNQYGDVAAVSETYVLEDPNTTLDLRAVEAPAPAYFAHYVDPADPKAIGVTEARTVDGNSCLLAFSDPQGEETAEDTVTSCMRSSEDLTVWVENVEGLPETVLPLLDDAWEQLGGGEATAWPRGGDEPIELPQSVGELSDYSTNSELAYGAELAVIMEQDVALLSGIYGGSAAAETTYVDDELQNRFTLRAVRSDTPGEYVRYSDAERGGLLAPALDTAVFGQTACIVNNELVELGGDEGDLDPRAWSCMRTGNGLTVWIDVIGGDLGLDPETLAGYLDEVYEANV